MKFPWRRIGALARKLLTSEAAKEIAKGLALKAAKKRGLVK